MYYSTRCGIFFFKFTSRNQENLWNMFDCKNGKHRQLFTSAFHCQLYNDYHINVSVVLIQNALSLLLFISLVELVISACAYSFSSLGHVSETCCQFVVCCLEYFRSKCLPEGLDCLLTTGSDG